MHLPSLRCLAAHVPTQVACDPALPDAAHGKPLSSSHTCSVATNLFQLTQVIDLLEILVAQEAIYLFRLHWLFRLLEFGL